MVDARGYSCPVPVLMVQTALKKEKPVTLEVLVDNACAKENVTRFAGNNGYTVAAAPDGSDWKLTLKKD